VGSNPGFNKKLNGKNGPVDGSKYNKNNEENQMGQVTPKNFLSNFFCNVTEFVFYRIDIHDQVSKTKYMLRP